MSDSGPSGAEPNQPTKTLLAAYVAGTLREPFAVLIASYLQMKGSAARSIRIPTTGDEVSRHGASRDDSGVEDISTIMPLALRSYVARHQGALEWRKILPGIERCRISRDEHADASLLRCRPGSAIPAHTHRGLEAVLVLQGAFHDAHGQYSVGDIAVADGTINHRPIADRPLACIIFVVLEAPVRLTGPFGSLLQRLFGA